MDELERTAESPAHSSVPRGKLELHDAATALRRAEGIAGARLIGDLEGEAALSLAAAHEGRFERRTRVCAGPSGPRSRRRETACVGSRANGSASSRTRSVGTGGEELAALADIGWGVLLASGPEDSFDLTLVARRAAEDAGVPFLVVHALGDGAAGRAVAMISVPAEPAIVAFVGSKRLPSGK